MTITQRVESILKHSKEARNSDIELQIIYMQKSGLNLTSEQQQAFRDMDNLWTVRRERQKLQEQGKYEADAQVKTERKHKAMVVQQNAPRASPEYMEQLITRRPLDWRTET